jgi:hypothetical protein
MARNPKPSAIVAAAFAAGTLGFSYPACAQYRNGDVDGDGIRDPAVRGLSNDYPAVAISLSSGGTLILRSPFHDMAFFGSAYHGDGGLVAVRGYQRLGASTEYSPIDVVFNVNTRTPVASLRVASVATSWTAGNAASGQLTWEVANQPANLAGVVTAVAAGGSAASYECVPVLDGWVCYYRVSVGCGVDCGEQDPGAGVPPSTIDPPDGGGIFPPVNDCNQNGIPDEDELEAGSDFDCDGDGLIDDCEVDCDDDGLPDDCELDLD